MSEVKTDKLSPRTDSGTTTLGDSGDTFLVNTGAKLDVNGTELILDADADTSITADTDDQIDIRIAGADDFQFTANTFTVNDGSTIANLVVSGDTAASDNAAIGYTAAEGLILTGQGSTDDITIKNDADTTVLNVATGATDVEISAGNILFGTASKGVYLGVTSATAANLLDDYEEGTYTLTLEGMSSGSFGVSSANDTASYTKVGRMVFICGQLNADSESSCSGAIRLNLPFTTENSAEGANSGKTWVQLQNHGDGGVENPAVVIQHNVAYAQIQNMTDGGTSEAIDNSRLDTNFHISFSFHYLAA